MWGQEDWLSGVFVSVRDTDCRTWWTAGLRAYKGTVYSSLLSWQVALLRKPELGDCSVSLLICPPWPLLISSKCEEQQNSARVFLANEWVCKNEISLMERQLDLSCELSCLAVNDDRAEETVWLNPREHRKGCCCTTEAKRRLKKGHEGNYPSASYRRNHAFKAPSYRADQEFWSQETAVGNPCLQCHLKRSSLGYQQVWREEVFNRYWVWSSLIWDFL